MFEREYEERDQEEVMELIENFEQMVKDDSQMFYDEASFEQIIEYYNDRQDLDKAMHVVEMAIEQHPFSASFLIKKAHVLFDKKAYDEALVVLDQAAVLDSGEIQLHLLRCDIFVWQGKFAEAVETIELAKTFADEDEMPDLFLELADIYEEWEKYDDLFNALTQTLKLSPTNEEALSRLWFCVEFTEKYAASVAFHKRFIDEHPYAHLAWFNLAHAYAGMKKYDEAIEAFSFVVAIDEEYEYAYKDMAEIYFKLEDYEKAAENFIQASLLSKPYKELYYSIGECYEMMGNFNRSRNYYRKAGNLDPYFADAFYKIGSTYEEEGKYESALTAYERAFKLEKESADFAFALAVVHRELGDMDNAISFFKLAVELEPDEKDYWIDLARAYFDAAEYRDALSVLSKAILQFEKSADLYFIKSAFYFQIGNTNESFTALERALLQDNKGYAIIFEVAPLMQKDATVINIIDQYSDRV